MGIAMTLYRKIYDPMSSKSHTLLWASRTVVMSIILLLSCVSIVWAQGPFLSVRESISVSGPDILLQDIVQMATSLPEGWGDRMILKSPNPGKTEDYALTSIAYALQKYPDMKDVTLRGRMQLSVSRKAVQVSDKEIQQAIVEFVADNPEWQNTRYEIEILPFTSRIMVSPGTREVHVEHWVINETTGYIDFDVAICVDGLPERMVSVPVDLIQLQEMWIAGRDLSRGHILELDDLDVKYYPMGRKQKNYTPVNTSLTGMELTRNVREGHPIIKYLVRPPVCAERGDSINVYLAKAGLSVTLRAKALGKGRVGDRILCLNEMSERHLLVRLIGDHQGIVEN